MENVFKCGLRYVLWGFGGFCGCGVAKLPLSNPVCVWQISDKACSKRCWVDLKQVYANSLANMQINS